MSLLVRFAPTNVTVQQYNEVMEKLEAGGDWPPEGLEYHVCFGEESNIAVSEIWDSQEQFDAFGERLMPVLQDAGIDPGEPAVIPVHNIVKR